MFVMEGRQWFPPESEPHFTNGPIDNVRPGDWIVRDLETPGWYYMSWEDMARKWEPIDLTVEQVKALDNVVPLTALRDRSRAQFDEFCREETANAAI